MPGINVNILIHGLFFMTQEVNNLRIYAPNIKDHHFIGGMRGTRQELSGLYDFSGWGLRGKADPQTGRPTPAPNTDVDGSIMQFSPTDIGPLKPPGDSTFLGSILLPWPVQVIGLRTGDITKSPGPDPTTKIGKKVLDNAAAKGSSAFGVVALLRYTLPALPQTGGVSQFNIHYYLQPCKEHTVGEVNVDLGAAASCFTNAGFDLRMVTTPQEPNPIPASGHIGFGTAAEDEQSVHEEFDNSPDIQSICKNDSQAVTKPQNTESIPAVHTNAGVASSATPLNEEAVSPANCPVFFVG